MMKLLIRIIVLAAGINVYSVWADQHEPEEEESGEQQVQTEIPPVQESTRPSESFVPTESISEDLSVPFPVDI